MGGVERRKGNERDNLFKVGGDTRELSNWQGGNKGLGLQRYMQKPINIHWIRTNSKLHLKIMSNIVFQTIFHEYLNTIHNITTSFVGYSFRPPSGLTKPELILYFSRKVVYNTM